MTFTRKCASALLAGGALAAFSLAAQAQEETPSAALTALDSVYEDAAYLLPPNAKPGECYARVFIPATEKQVERRVLVKEESERLDIVAAKYEWIDETIETQSASVELEVIPAQFETREKVVTVEPEREDQTAEAPIYETVEEQVLVRAAYTTWQKGEGPIQRYDEATGEIMCLVTIPAEYVTIQKQVVRTPARVVTKPVAAKTQTLETRVMIAPPSTREIEIPARFETVKVQKLTAPTQVVKVAIPAEYETLRETVKETAGKMEWRPILCATNTTPDLVMRIQRALDSGGYKLRQIVGQLGPGTMQMVRQYQRDKGLAQGQITMEFLDSLGVAVN